MTDFLPPRLITFDGEARSGKGTIVQFTKDYLRDELGLKVMLIDRGQTFRTLVVAATRAGVDLDDAEAIEDMAVRGNDVGKDSFVSVRSRFLDGLLAPEWQRY